MLCYFDDPDYERSDLVRVIRQIARVQKRLKVLS